MRHIPILKKGIICAYLLIFCSHLPKIGVNRIKYMVGPKDGGFGFDQSKKYSEVENLEKICVQCQAGQHKKCLAKSKQQPSCDCEYCIIYG